MFFRSITLAVLFLSFNQGMCSDTLYTNPNYPPLVYTNSEIDFYKYTPKFVPNDLLHAFKILGTNEPEILERFKQRTVPSVVHNGIHFASSRLRKEFCLEGYSDFVFYFHERGIYYPYAMETYILLGFHQYLNQEKITWRQNKSIALENDKKRNRLWKKRRKKLFKKGKIKVKESEPPKGDSDKSKSKKSHDAYQF